MQQGPAASTGDRSRSSAGGGWGRRRGAPRPRGGRAGTGPAGWGHTGRTASPAPPCGGHSRRVHGGLSGARQVQGTELLSRGPDEEWPWPRADPSLHRETGHSSGTRTGRKAGSWPLVPAGTLPAGAAGGRTPLAPTRLPGLVPHCRGGLSIPESPLWTRHSPAGLWGHNQAPEGVWQPAQAPPAPGRARGRGLRSPGNELTSVPSLLAGADPSSPGPPEAGSEQTPSAPREPGDLPGAPRLPEQLRKTRGPAVSWVNTGSREV